MRCRRDEQRVSQAGAFILQSHRQISEPAIAVHDANPAWLLGWKNLDVLLFGS